MPANAPNNDRPFVETSIVRLMISRMTVTHEECGITVISGPWGIGKTTAIDAFARTHEFSCSVVKIEPGATRRGATAGAVMRQVVEELRRANGKQLGTQLSNATWTLRSQIHNELSAYTGSNPDDYREGTYPNFTFIFDEAQNLSREAIDMLRYWNDKDRTTTPFPTALIFVGNPEFALAESLGGQSVLSGAVRSRLLFEEQLTSAYLDDVDLTVFCQSRGIQSPEAITAIIDYYRSGQGGRREPPKRNLHQLDRRIIPALLRRAGGKPVTAEIVRSVLNP